MGIQGLHKLCRVKLGHFFGGGEKGNGDEMSNALPVMRSGLSNALGAF